MLKTTAKGNNLGTMRYWLFLQPSPSEDKLFFYFPNLMETMIYSFLIITLLNTLTEVTEDIRRHIFEE